MPGNQRAITTEVERRFPCGWRLSQRASASALTEEEDGMPSQAPCKICGTPAEHVPDQWFPEWDCPRCGRYDFDQSLGWRPVGMEERIRLSGWVREQNAAGIKPLRISQEMSGRVCRRPLPSLRDRANRALLLIARKYPEITRSIGFAVFFGDLELQGICYCKGPDDVRVLLFILIDDGYLDADR